MFVSLPFIQLDRFLMTCARLGGQCIIAYLEGQCCV